VKLTKLDWHAVAGVFACIVLLTLPFAHSVAIRTIALGLAWVAALAAWRQLAVPRIPLLWLFAVWAGLALFSLTWAVDRDYSASELKTEVLYPFLVFALFFALGEQPWLERFRRTLMAATLLAFVSAVYWAVFSDWGYTGGFFNGPGMYSTYLVGVYPFALVWLLRRESSVRERWLHVAVLAAVLAGGAITHNRMLWIVLAIQTVFVFVALPGAMSRRRRVTIAMVPVLVLGAALYAISSKRFVVDPAVPEAVGETLAKDVRPRVWDWAAQRIAERPLTGAGFGRGALREAFRAQFGDPQLWHAHNTILNYGLGMGVWGIALIVLIFGLVLGMLWRALRSGDAALAPYALAAVAMVIGMFAKNLTDDLFVRQSALLYWAIAGMTLGAHARRREA
jgi:O-antigen ligase